MNSLNITIGPVQGFVVQARRTRDLWSGSFLLSYLSGCAMVAAEDAAGKKIHEPEIEGDHLIALIRSIKLKGKENVNVDTSNLIGSLPNRFKIECENPETVATVVKKAFDNAWNDIAENVWNRYLKDVTTGYETRKIWDRQVTKFWEFNWTVGEQETVDARKNWRRQDVPVEGGDHCTLMYDYQELSGHVRFKYRKKQDEFWKSIKAGELDLKPDERLCAIAFIKRFFPNVSKEAIGVDLKSTHWPSTVYMAAVPWLRNVEDDELARSHYELVKKCTQGALRPEIPKMIGLKNIGPFAQLDGNFYFKNMIRSENSTPLRHDSGDCRKDLERSLGNVKSKPFPYYVLLKMDGDNLGKMKRKYDSKVNDISKALSDFSRKVPRIVREHNGVTIYAGGDDVLSMLPMDTALSCANELSNVYRSSFISNGIDSEDMTISAGLVYSHYHLPLQSMYQEAHHLLDDIAKDGNDRDSVAVSVWKASGKYLQWVSKWDEEDNNVVDKIQSAVNEYSDERTFSSSLMYSVRESIALLTDSHNWQPGQEMDIDILDSELNLESLIIADIMRSRVGNIRREEVRKKLKPILDLCYGYDKNNNKIDKTKFAIDGWFLVRFLSKGGGE